MNGYTPWSPPSITWYFSTSLIFPSDAHRSLIRLAAKTWSNKNALSISEVSKPNYTITNQGAAAWEPLETDIGGQVSFIQFTEPPNPNPSRFKISISSAIPSIQWHVGQTKPPLSKVDMWSTATHEFGHVALVAHITESSKPTKDCPQPNPNGSDHRLPDLLKYPTMCPVQMPGQWHFRTLGTYDRNSVLDIY